MPINKRMDEARQLAQQGKKGAALALIEELLADYPDNPDQARLWSLRGSIYSRQGDYDEAIQSMCRAIALSNQSHQRATFYYHRGRYNFQSGNGLAAVDDLGEALNNDDQSDITFTEALYFYRAEAFLRLGKKQEALSDLSHVRDDYQTWTFKLRSKADLMADCTKLQS